MSESSMLLEAYSRNPVNQYDMEDATISYEQGNPVCGDGIVVFLRIEDNSIVEFSHGGAPALHTLAAVGLLSEYIVGMDLQDVLKLGYKYMKGLGLEVSTRRQRSVITGLLATRNAIHQYLEDGEDDDYADLLES